MQHTPIMKSLVVYHIRYRFLCRINSLLQDRLYPHTQYLYLSTIQTSIKNSLRSTARFLQNFFFQNVHHITLPLEVPYNAFQNSPSTTLLPNIPITEHAFANLKSRLRIDHHYTVLHNRNTFSRRA